MRKDDAVETISEAFVLWDNQNRLVMCNSKYQQFHGLSDELVQPGSPYDEVIAAASEPIVSKRIAVAGKEIDDCRTYEAQIEDGRWLHINERRTRDGGYVSVGTDITVLKESQHRLAESEHQLRASVAEWGATSSSQSQSPSAGVVPYIPVAFSDATAGSTSVRDTCVASTASESPPTARPPSSEVSRRSRRPSTRPASR